MQHVKIKSGTVFAAEFNNDVELLVVQVAEPAGQALKEDLVIQQGANFVKRVQLLDRLAREWDMNNWLVRQRVRANRDSSSTLLAGIFEGGDHVGFPVPPGPLGHIVNHTTDGFFDIVVDADETDQMTWTDGEQDLELVLIGSQVNLFNASMVLDADNGSGQGTITASAGTPFSTVATGNLIRIVNAEDAVNNGTYTVLTATGTVLTFKNTLGYRLGVDRAADTALGIQKLTLDERYVIRLLQGRAKNVLAVTR